MITSGLGNPLAFLHYNEMVFWFFRHINHWGFGPRNVQYFLRGNGRGPQEFPIPASHTLSKQVDISVQIVWLAQRPKMQNIALKTFLDCLRVSQPNRERRANTLQYIQAHVICNGQRTIYE